MAQSSAWDETIVLIAGPVHEFVPTNEYDRSIDQPFLETVERIRSSLERCSKRVIYFSELADFTREISAYPDCLVFPYWFGQKSRSRHGLVPAICEAADIMFVGASAFAKIVCNDKELSKLICRQAGLAVPTSALLNNIEDLPHARHLKFPVVVKPNYEGTSLGITQRNLCKSWKEVELIVDELFEKLGQPVIIEEFAPGTEFSACLIGNIGSDTTISIGSWQIDGDVCYLDERLNTFDLKLPNDINFEFNIITSNFEKAAIQAFRTCFDCLGKTEILRIDGRFHEGNVTILELTPDIYLGTDGEFCLALGYNEDNYDDFISRIIRNSLKGYEADMPRS